MQYPPLVWKIKGKDIAGPQNFDPATLFDENYIANHPRNPFYVATAYSSYDEVLKEEGYTVYQYSYVTINGFRICVVDHAHIRAWSPDEFNKPWIAGHSYIPGLPGRDWTTPKSIVTWLQTNYKDAAVTAFTNNPDLRKRPLHDLLGNFPNDERYPKKL